MKKNASRGDSHKLMDRLPPDPSLGRLIGILATSYEFQPEFFETDFLPTLLGLGAWDDRSWTSRIALEKHLAGLEVASVLVDARPYRGRPRSLRVEILPVFLEAGRVLHAKILAAVYENAVRLIFGSANLTEPGYRKNREVAAVLTASKERPREAQLVREAMHGFRQLLTHWTTPGALHLCELVDEQLKVWASAAPPPDQWFAWGSTQQPLWRKFVEQWPTHDNIARVTIVSPFWSDDAATGPVTTLIETLRNRGALGAQVKLRLLTEAVPDKNGTWKPQLPDSYATFDAATIGVSAEALAVDPTVSPEEVGMEDDFFGVRRLHAKLVLLEGAETSLVYFGSANFTRLGWGFLPNPQNANVEAGLIVRRSGSARGTLGDLIPATIGDPVPLSGAAAGRLAPPEPSPEMLPWPDFLHEVLLSPSAEDLNRLELVAVIDPCQVAGHWRIEHLVTEGEPSAALLSDDGGSPGQLRFHTPLEDSGLERLLRDQEVRVTWWQCEVGRAFPLNVDATARSSLPIAPGSGRLDEQHLIAYYQGRITWEDLFPDPDEKKGEGGGTPELVETAAVDTSRIQSYIVREFVEALKGITDDLKAAAQSPSSCMRLALLGSVSPVALARRVLEAAVAGQRTAMAAGFQLVEILGCLDAARGFPASARFCNDWSELIDESTEQLLNMLDSLRQSYPHELSGDFRRYAKTVRKHYQTKGNPE